MTRRTTGSVHVRTPAAMLVSRQEVEAARLARHRKVVAEGTQRELERRRDKEAWEREIVGRMEGERAWLAERQTGLPTAPCFKCGAARWCSHRKPDPA